MRVCACACVCLCVVEEPGDLHSRHYLSEQRRQRAVTRLNGAAAVGFDGGLLTAGRPIGGLQGQGVRKARRFKKNIQIKNRR